jgi:1-acyl-sn-glycerol-3-phosphate acyltransferase
MLRVIPGILRALLAAVTLPLFTLLLLVAAILALVLPGLAARRAVTRWLAKIALLALGLRVSSQGLGHLPDDSCVVVANHSSYLDGIIMKAVLPPRFSFVIKREAAEWPVVGLLLKRIGSQFVERGSHGARQRDARRVMRHAEEGHSLVFFPEGTFGDEPGLRRFHVGAFVAAQRANVPVVPAVIHGARRALPNGRVAPRPGRIAVEILEPLAPVEGGHAAEMLRDTARRLIAGRLDEPDLMLQREPA